MAPGGLGNARRFAWNGKVRGSSEAGEFRRGGAVEPADRIYAGVPGDPFSRYYRSSSLSRLVCANQQQRAGRVRPGRVVATDGDDAMATAPAPKARRLFLSGESRERMGDRTVLRTERG